MMEHTGSQVDSRGRCEGEGKYCVYEGMVCLLDGTDGPEAMIPSTN